MRPLKLHINKWGLSEKKEIRSLLGRQLEGRLIGFDKEKVTKAAFAISSASFIHYKFHASFYSLEVR